ncbi:MAG: SRPBCC family protein [Acidimicrobiales bacterium]
MELNTETVTYLSAPVAEVMARRQATKLRNLMRLNSEFSIVTGLIGLIGAGRVAELFDVEQVWVIRLLAAGLIGFAGIVFAVSGMRTSRLRKWSQIVSLNDFGWVFGTVVVIALGQLSAAGALVMGTTGIVVLLFGAAQLRARARLIEAIALTQADLDEVPPVEILEFSRPSSSTAEESWPIMTNHSLYAKLALNLKAAESVTPNGPGFERTCTDSLGRTWAETCTLWEAGRRFDVNVDISDYPYPLQVVQGSWRVDPAESATSAIGMRFAIRPKPGLYGRVFVPAMHLTFTPILKRIAKGWQQAALQDTTVVPLVE